MILNLFKPEYKIDWNQFKFLVEQNPQLVSDLLKKIIFNRCQCQRIFRIFNLDKDQYSDIRISELIIEEHKSPRLISQYVYNKMHRKLGRIQDQLSIKLTRQVRLVSVFIRTLIKQKIFDPEKIYVELQGFCLEFSSILEATQLFKTIKNAVQEQ
ncbi:unnamed protein product [Paramecium primaurelia]|uniref:CCR4-NOT transcription complex subunit 11 n=1 Tax=Paramecium primaurelia TaxID=5886 RepID=A0A8S1PMN5_PARPR|nr:unnamed protein product [Paramecium primaurelia]